MRKGPLILLVDDEEVFLEIASLKLRKRGFETVLSHDVRDAFTKAEALLPDLLLSDVYMPPGPSGIELAYEIHRNPKTRNMKIAFFTSLRDPWAEIRWNRETIKSELGSVSFFNKTDDVERLADGVARILSVAAA